MRLAQRRCGLIGLACAGALAAAAGGGGPCPGDIDGDWDVGITDFLQLIAVWGTSDSGADIDGNGVVDVLDFLELLNSWGPCS